MDAGASHSPRRGAVGHPPETGSRYTSPMRSDTCTALLPPCTPERPTGSPRATHLPTSTSTAARYEYDVRTPPPWSTVTERRPAIEPANVTTPAPSDRTLPRRGEATSTPKWPLHCPVGPNGLTIRAGSGTAGVGHPPGAGVDARTAMSAAIRYT